MKSYYHSGIAASGIVKDIEIYLPLEELIDIEKEKNRLKKELNRFQELIENVNKKLSNSAFFKKAPAEIIEREKRKKAHYELTFNKIKNNFNILMGE